VSISKASYRVYYIVHWRSCGAVYCNHPCLFVCGSVTAITRNCMHRSSPKWVCRWR